MLLVQQQPAYVLHARAYRETSLLLECLTRDHGRLGVVARGVRGPRSRLRRADLEPFQSLALDYSQRGELATLRGVEPIGALNRLRGDGLLSGLYVNELVVRLCARQDAQPGLFDAYAEILSRLDAGAAPAWPLRRFERDLLQALGYAMQLRYDAQDGEALDPQAFYRYQPDGGPERCGPQTPQAVRGEDLLALADDRCPDDDGLRRLRVLMRDVLRFHLGGTELRAWRMLRPGPPPALR
ncbi:DNA repair protein RecO [Oleiagrimonas soli]|uniref:DNA repair protein RecO n=1 Tax=Oleiagrimonas soli TaxID=1543381 RepID=A0A099CUK8_9GAMM|nr:DNA repair protein RecO [Oleiagrimonas soli]KGI77459.1 DNA recombination protein RecO [Oleiagrimonas soli]MBB6183095.1 DNA repair protein RecO (recombination protein O) [Oleiagrimonas soli]